MDGYQWDKLDASFKLGWVTGYTKAMDLAAIIQMSRCASEMPMYTKEYPNTVPKVIMQKLCLSDTKFDYDGITMGQFVAGMDAFYRDYRNKQLEVGNAIEYARDSIRGKPAQDLDAEVTSWRRCTAAFNSHSVPRSSEDMEIIKKACGGCEVAPTSTEDKQVKQKLPVAACTKCGHVSYNIAGVGATCGRMVGGKRCRGVYSSRLNVGDWVECDGCAASGFVGVVDAGGSRCVTCDGVGWLATRRF
jgi:hypothetical protein